MPFTRDGIEFAPWVHKAPAKQCTAAVQFTRRKFISAHLLFEFEKKPAFTIVDKGSVCIDGVSLTVVKAKGKKFSVAIIPYTLQHTIFHTYKVGSTVNIEFDILGKYVERLLKFSKGKI